MLKGCLAQHVKERAPIFEVLLSDLRPGEVSDSGLVLEICEVCTLHGETFYPVQDFFVGFMLTQRDIDKNMLQPIGMTS